MKKKEIFELNEIFNRLKDLGDTKFKYFSIKNINLLKPSIEPLLEIEKSNKLILQHFEKDRNTLITKLGIKENGLIYIDIKDEIALNKFNKGLEIIIENHKLELDNYQKSMEEFNLLLNEDVDDQLEFKTISIDECPKEGIDSKELEILLKYNIIT